MIEHRHTPSTFLILDSGLFLPVGHHFGYNESVADAVRKLGVDTRIYGAKRTTSAEILSSSSASFSTCLYDRFPASDLSRRLLIHANEILSILFRHGCDALPIVFFPNASILDLLALNHFPEIISNCAKISLVLRFFENRGLFTDQEDANQMFIEAAQRASRLDESIRFYTDTPALVRAWSEVGIETSLIPIPITEKIYYTPPFEPKRFQLCSLGQTSPEKGLYDNLNLLASLSKCEPPVNSFFQTTYYSVDENLRASLPNVIFNTIPLPTPDYYAILSESSVYLNLYNPTAYAHGSSNSLLEAVIAGCLPLCSDYTFAREILGHFSHFFIAGDSIHSREQKLRELLQCSGRINDISLGLHFLAKKLRSIHNPSALAQHLLTDV